MPFWIANLCVLNVALVVDERCRNAQRLDTERNVSVIVFCQKFGSSNSPLKPF